MGWWWGHRISFCIRMTPFFFIVGIAFVAGMVARSLVITPPPPRVISVQTEPVERESRGCLPIILVGAVVLLLLAFGSG